MLQQVAIERGVNQLDCDTVVEYRGKLSCTFPEFDDSGEIIVDGSKVFTVDHVHPHSAREMELVVLYADVENDDFATFHSKIMDLVRRGRITYVFRHFLAKRSQQKVRMSGMIRKPSIVSVNGKIQNGGLKFPTIKKTGLFNNHIALDHSKTGHIQYSRHLFTGSSFTRNLQLPDLY